jgi:hypothetical protein
VATTGLSLQSPTASPGARCAPIWDPALGSTQEVFKYPGYVVNGIMFIASVSVGDSALARDIMDGQVLEIVRMVDHTRTTGPGACTGCSMGASVGTDVIWLYSTDGRIGHKPAKATVYQTAHRRSSNTAARCEAGRSA